MPHKYFTLDEANRTLPLVQRVVADITALYPRWRDLVYRYELIAARSNPDRGESEEQIDLRNQIEDVAREINGYLVELDQVGCVFKGFEQGLVDFYGRVDDRDILWCWKLGEPAVAHWHELETGYAGRKPVTAVRSA